MPSGGISTTSSILSVGGRPTIQRTDSATAAGASIASAPVSAMRGGPPAISPEPSDVKPLPPPGLVVEVVFVPEPACEPVPVGTVDVVVGRAVVVEPPPPPSVDLPALLEAIAASRGELQRQAFALGPHAYAEIRTHSAAASAPISPRQMKGPP